MSKVSKVLNICDNKKSAAIEGYLKEHYDRVLLPTNLESDEQNCLTESVLNQVSNKDFMENPDTQELYSPQHLRLQCVMWAVQNLEETDKLIKHFLSCPLKEYLYKMCSKDTEGDIPLLMLARKVLEVRILNYYYAFRILQHSRRTSARFL